MLREGSFAIKSVLILLVALCWAPDSQARARNSTYKVKNLRSCLNFRTGPSTRNRRIRCLRSGTKMTYLGRRGRFAKVKVNGRIGYVSKNYIRRAANKIQNKSAITTPTSNRRNNKRTYSIKTRGSCLRLRSGPSTRRRILKCVPNGSKVTYLGKRGNFLKVKINGRIGYMSKRYLHSQNLPPQKKAAAQKPPTVNVASKNSPQLPVVDTLTPSGDATSADQPVSPIAIGGQLPTDNDYHRPTPTVQASSEQPVRPLIIGGRLPTPDDFLQSQSTPFTDEGTEPVNPLSINFE